MNSFVSGIKNGGLDTRTDNGMLARSGSGDACTDFFFKAGAMRGQNIIPTFEAAFVEEPELALRLALWLRDVRGGAGERKLARDIMLHLCNHPHAVGNMDVLGAMFVAFIEVGRWDDLVWVANNLKSTHDIYQGILSVCQFGLKRGVDAVDLLNKIDDMSEEQCQHILDTF